MTVGPLRRATGLVGLVALAPTAVMLATGALAPQEAAMRAVAVLVAVVVVGHAARVTLTGLVQRFERRAGDPSRLQATSTATGDTPPTATGSRQADRRRPG